MKRRSDAKPPVPIRLDQQAGDIRRLRADQILTRHSPEDVIAASIEERRRWIIDAMLAFADEERRRAR